MKRSIKTSMLVGLAFSVPSEWDGRVFSSGWVASNGGSHDIMVPVTGNKIGRYGVADSEDVSRAAAAAATAQKSWAAATYEQRSAVLRRAGDLIEKHCDVLSGWLIREVGSAKGKAAFELHVVSGEYYAASAIAMAPFGQMLRSGKPRLSLARRIPVGTVGVISPFNFPQILSIRSVAPRSRSATQSSLSPTCAPRSQAGPPSRRSCARPVCPRGSSTCSRAASRPAAPWWSSRPCG